MPYTCLCFSSARFFAIEQFLENRPGHAAEDEQAADDGAVEEHLEGERHSGADEPGARQDDESRGQDASQRGDSARPEEKLLDAETAFDRQKRSDHEGGVEVDESDAQREAHGAERAESEDRAGDELQDEQQRESDRRPIASLALVDGDDPFQEGGRKADEHFEQIQHLWSSFLVGGTSV